MTEDKYKQSNDELMSQLEEQIKFIISSSKSFDEGNEAEAKRLANHLRTLLYDTKNSHSLLGQLKKKENMLFYDTAWRFNSENLIPSCCLSKYAIQGSNMYYIPRNLQDVSQCRKIIFKDWWDKQVIIHDKHHSKFTRRDLVLFVADQDGGCHVDPGLDKKFANLSRLNSMGWVPANSVNGSIRNKVELSCIRQIAHEIIKALADEFPELLIEVPECTYEKSVEAILGRYSPMSER